MTKRKADTVTGIALGLLLALVSAVVMMGCAARVKTVTNLPPGVTQKQAQDWDAAVADLHRIAATTTTLREAVMTLNQRGVIKDGPAYGAFLTGIGHIAQYQIAATTLLQQAPQNFSPSVQQRTNNYVNQITAELQKLNDAGATWITDKDSLVQIDGLLTEIAAAANLELALTQ